LPGLEFTHRCRGAASSSETRNAGRIQARLRHDNAGRLKDLADVQELIRALKLERAYEEKLNPYVRAKFVELWDAVQGDTHSD
jgi:hypothetical protein